MSTTVCEFCRAPASQRCATCKRSYYCNRKHQKKDFPLHKLKCFENGCVLSAYYLIQAVYADIFPSLPAVLVDYGFLNCKTNEQETCLLGLYQGLIKFTSAKPIELHEACMKGKLADFIVEKFEEMLAKNQLTAGKYYPWFLENKDIVKNPYPL